LKKYLSSYWIRSALFTILQRFSVTLFGFLNFIILIRSLTKPEMGVWAFFLVVTTLFETAKSSLLKNAHVKFVGNNNEEKTAIASSSLLLNAAISILFVLFLFLFSGKLSFWLGAGAELEQMLKWFIPGMFFLVFFSHFEAVSQSHLDFKSIFGGYFTRQVVFFIIISVHVFFKIHFSLIDVVIYQSISIVFATVVIFLLSKKHLLYVFNPSTKWIKELLGFGGYIFGIAITANIFANIDQLMIGRFTSSKSMVANYNSSTRISALVDIPTYAAAEILLPKISQVDANKDYYQVSYMYERMVAILLCFTTPIALLIFFFPKPVISMIAGKQYLDASFILQMYMLSALVKPIQIQAANVFLYIGKARLCFLLNLLFLGVSCSLNYLCFTQFGAYGAAIGNVISCVLGMIVWYSILQKSIDVRYTNIAKHVVGTYKTIYSKAILLKKIKQTKLSVKQ
jgi:O-antigen/teichoic acid export membrane protein